MRRFLLDTDTCIYALKQKHGVLGRMLAKPRDSIHLSVITESELRFGVAKSKSAVQALELLENFLQPLQVLEYGIRRCDGLGPRPQLNGRPGAELRHEGKARRGRVAGLRNR